MIKKPRLESISENLESFPGAVLAARPSIRKIPLFIFDVLVVFCIWTVYTPRAELLRKDCYTTTVPRAH